MTEEEALKRWPWGPELIKQFREVFGDDAKYTSITDPSPPPKPKETTYMLPFKGKL